MKTQIIKGAACISNVGKKRQNNEDNFYFGGKTFDWSRSNSQETLSAKQLNGDYFIAGIFDGMGGEACGEVASLLCAKTAKSVFRLIRKTEGKKLLVGAIRKMNDEVVREMKRKKVSMGSTASLVYIDADGLTFANVGDSPIIEIKGKKAMAISVEHTEAETLKLIDPSLVVKGKKYSLTQFVGIDPKEMLLEPYVRVEKRTEGTRYVICSDGLTDMVDMKEIGRISDEEKDVKACVEKLVEAALNNGGRDNITVLAVDL